MRFLITGTAGFIGFHLAPRLLDERPWVGGVDGMTPYYDVKLKQARHALLERSDGFRRMSPCWRTMPRCGGSPRTSGPT